eukprot:UN26477
MFHHIDESAPDLIADPTLNDSKYSDNTNNIHHNCPMNGKREYHYHENQRRSEASFYEYFSKLNPFEFSSGKSPENEIPEIEFLDGPEYQNNVNSEDNSINNDEHNENHKRASRSHSPEVRTG